MADTLLQQVRTLAREHDMFPSAGHILCALSGGLDSMCLLHILSALSDQFDFSVTVAHFNHHLRREADEDEAFVRSWCAQHSIPLVCGGGDVAGQARLAGRGIEETARTLRYAFLEQAAQEVGANRIATAHTANDNAETLLLHLVRGSGLQGLTGIPPRRGAVIRPLLRVTRANLEGYCRAHHVPHVEDITNTDESYTRNYLRRQVLPLLCRVNPKVVESMSDSAATLRADNDYLNALAEQAISSAHVTSDCVTVQACLLQQLPQPVAIRCAQRLLELAGACGSTAAHRRILLDLCRSSDPSARADLPGIVARRVYDELILTPTRDEPPLPTPTPLNQEGETVYGSTGWVVSCRKVQLPVYPPPRPNAFYLSCAAISHPPVLRPRKAGDAIKLPGRDTKTLKKLFIDEKYPLTQRELLPVLADASGVLAVAGFGPDTSRLATDGEAAYEIFLRKSEKNGNYTS